MFNKLLLFDSICGTVFARLLALKIKYINSLGLYTSWYLDTGLIDDRNELKIPKFDDHQF